MSEREWHFYNDILWSIIQDDIPSIIKELQQISINK